MGLIEEVSLKNDQEPITFTENTVAKTLNDVQNLIARAKSAGIKEILVTENVLKFLMQEKYDPNHACMVYQDVFLYQQDKVDAIKYKNGRNVEEVVFGKKTGIIQNNINTVK